MALAKLLFPHDECPSIAIIIGLLGLNMVKIVKKAKIKSLEYFECLGCLKFQLALLNEKIHLSLWMKSKFVLLTVGLQCYVCSC